VARAENGPEFIAKAFLAWAQSHQIKRVLIQPGCPSQNAYTQRFKGGFRYDCLNEHWFTSLTEARAASSSWRSDYNQVRPHSSIGS
jgi:putative transposase